MIVWFGFSSGQFWTAPANLEERARHEQSIFFSAFLSCSWKLLFFHLDVIMNKSDNLRATILTISSSSLPTSCRPEGAHSKGRKIRIGRFFESSTPITISPGDTESADFRLSLITRGSLFFFLQLYLYLSHFVPSVIEISAKFRGRRWRLNERMFRRAESS